VARCLIVACGCRGRELAVALRGEGHVVRGTSRSPSGLRDIEAAGAEAIQADPDRVATLVPALEHATVAVLLLGSASGAPGLLSALHGPRLEMLLTKVLDTTVRGVVYEACGTVKEDVLSSGAEVVRRMCGGSRIPYRLLDLPRDAPGWAETAVGCVEALLGG
jgi:nucleoside-diphosphate-sugar epimerase